MEGKLQKVAFEKSAKAIWIGVDNPPKDGDACLVEISLYDDEWLTTYDYSTVAPRVSRYDPGYSRLGSAAAAGDLLTLRQRLGKQKFPQEDLDGALLETVYSPSDNTDVISLLLGAGVNVNAQVQTDGSTVLMSAVHSLNLSNIKLLLSSGADVSLKTRGGRTAYTIAMEMARQFEAKDSCIPAPSYLPDLLALLKPPQTAVSN